MNPNRKARVAGSRRTIQEHHFAARFAARPSAAAHGDGASGLARMGLEDGRDAMLYVPRGHRADVPAPFALMLHGAGGSGQNAIPITQPFADAAGMIILAPDSRVQTWDVIRGGFGPDVAYIDAAMERVFARYAVDAARVAVGGFSDGGSYALSLGVANGDLFTHVLAFSPGFMSVAEQQGAPRIYVSHGTGDTVLPIDRCSRVLVPRLRNAGYDVLYREFDGPHTVPPDLAREAVDWFTGPTAA